MSRASRKFATVGELRESRRRYVTEARENGFEDGLRTLLADLYPDNAHFIYELLQNAEDAGAGVVEFDLKQDRLVVSHDGPCPFVLDDIEAITGIGQSAKKDDPTQIGKFGVGFKAVFAYTDHPEVHSGDHAFVIEDLFVPEEVSASHAPGKTVFVLPFDRADKPPADAYDEIARGLKELDSSTVLFLSRIRTVKYRLADGDGGHVDRSDADAPIIAITESTGDDSKTSRWLRLVGHPVGTPDHLTVAAAFSLQEAASTSERSRPPGRLRIRPLEAGQTCIYFPASKETSGLRFHIHAPFASTVARDSVRDTVENRQLVEAIGDLVVDALPRLRDEGFIDDGLLSALPNVDDALSQPYTTVRELVYTAFDVTALTPVHGGGAFAPATELVASPPEFRAAFDQSDLATMLLLTGDAAEPARRWVSPRTGRAGQFLKGLDIGEFGWTELTSALDTVESEFSGGAAEADDDVSVRAIWNRWLETRSDEQLRTFYELLGQGVLDRKLPYWFNVPFVRIYDGTTVDHVLGAGVFLPASRDDTGPDRVPISLAWFDDDEPDKSRSALEAFYAKCGVHKWDDRAVVSQRMDAYRSGDHPDLTQHVRDMRMFIDYLDSHSRDITLFQGAALLRGEDSDGKVWWVRPNGLVIDLPYEPTGLSALPGNKYRLSSEYRGRVAGVSEFARRLGAIGGLALQRVPPHENSAFDWSWRWNSRETGYGTKVDWDLADFESILRTRDADLLRALWDLACKEPSSRSQAVYQANGSSSRHSFASRIAQRMSTTEWVLDRYDELRSPQSMTEDLLPIGWPPPPPASLAMAVSFGADKRANDLEARERRAKADSLGISLELADEFAELDEEGQLELVAYARSLRDRPAFPEASSSDPERRGRLVGDDARDAPRFATETRERSVTVGAASEVKARADAYLREQYTTDDRCFCQACHQPAEFKVSDKWYFEKVQFVPGRKHLHHENYLALCPACAAKYKYVRLPDDEGLVANLAELSVAPGAGTVALPITLNGRRVELNFTGKHAIDLRAVLTAAGDAREQ